MQFHSSCSTDKNRAWEATADSRHSHLKLHLLTWQVVESCGEASLLRRIGNFSAEQVGQLLSVSILYKHFGITWFLSYFIPPDLVAATKRCHQKTLQEELTESSALHGQKQNEGK